MSVDVNKVDIITSKIELRVVNLYELKNHMKGDQFLISNQFYNPKYPSVVWEMRVYPNTTANHANGQHATRGSFVSIIQKGLLNNKLEVNYNIYSIGSSLKQRIVIAASDGSFTTKTESPKYSIDFVTSYGCGDFILFGEVEFAVPYNPKCVENLIDCAGSTNISQKPFSNMFKQGILTDCVITIGNEKINAHRCVLANNSVVFQKMFEQEEMLESQNVIKKCKTSLQGEINIIDSSAEVFGAMLDYFYNGEINKNTLEKLVYDLFAIAHKYQVKSLMYKCEYIMATKIDKTNFTKNINYLQLYNLPILEKACVKYIAATRKTFLESNEWKNLEQLYKDKANYLLKLVLKNEF